MRQILLIPVLILFIVACSTQRNVHNNEQEDEAVSAEDSVEYHMKTFDSNFETWYKLQNNPSQYRSQEYYENWNRKYVPAWNSKIKSLKKDFVFEPIVGYRPNTDFGFKLNHKLFYYFQYVENVLDVTILEGGPKATLF